ncbi:MAG: hypothetical protein N2489_10800 [Clostridia bacterium]|nr:hypothetical protein [Clostridia bacterium]
MQKSLGEVEGIPKPKCHGGHFEHHVTGCHIDTCEELQDKSIVISSKFQKMGSCSRIKYKKSVLKLIIMNSLCLEELT